MVRVRLHKKLQFPAINNTFPSLPRPQLTYNPRGIFQTVCTLDTIRALWTSVHNYSSSQGKYNTQLWRKSHKTQSSVEVSTPPWRVRWWWWCLDGGQLTSWWRLMAGIGKQLVGTSPGPRTPALPHSTPAQNRFQTSFPLSRLGTQDYCAHIAEISASRRTLGGTRAALLSPTLTTLRLGSRHLADTRDLVYLWICEI